MNTGGSAAKGELGRVAPVTYVVYSSTLAALTALGSRRYDPTRHQGILLASPLQVAAEGESWRPAKLAVAFVADDRPGVFELERWFRRKLEV